MKLKDLKKPLDLKHIEWRIGRSGKKSNGDVWAVALAYITSRAVHDTFDEVCGISNWQLRYIEFDGGIVCEIGVKVGEEWIWKAGGADKTQIEAFKGGLSGAEKRAAVPWGVGRYLYGLTETFINDISFTKVQGWNYQAENTKKGIPMFYWKDPVLPQWALPHGTQKETDTSHARLWTTAQKGWLIEAGYTQNESSAKHTLDKSNLPGNAKKATVLQWGKYYRAKRDEDKTSDEAAKFANDKYEKRGK